MKLLIDTHVALWAVTQPELLPPRARALLATPDAAYSVSLASLWEIEIKFRLGRGGPGAIRIPARQALDLFEEAGFALLPITPAHIFAVGELPPLHGDPFDRLLVAQALAEPLRLLTADKALAEYNDTVIVI